MGGGGNRIRRAYVSTVGRQEARLSSSNRRGAAGGPLWRKAPFALLRYPGLLASVVLGVVLLALVASAYPLFLSRSGGGLLASQIGEPTVGRFGAGMFYSVTNVRFGERARGSEELLVDRLDDAFEHLASRGPHLGAPVRFVLGASAIVTRPGEGAPGSGPVSGRIFSGTHAEDHIKIVEGDGSDGAMVPDLVADPLGVGPGDLIQLNGIVTLRVGGVYEALYKRPRSGYWSPWSEQIYKECPLCPELPQFILVGPEEAVQLTRELRDPEERDVDYGWVAPIDDAALTVDEARDVRRYTDRILHRVTDRRTELGRLFACCGQDYVYGSFFFGRRDTEFRSSMPLVLREVDRRAATIEGPLRLLLIAGLGVAASVVAAAAAFAVAGRRTEAALLHARGWGPIRFAARSTVESFLPAVIGTAIGLALGWWLVAAFGPAAPAAASARSASVVEGAAAGAAALVVLATVTAVSFIRTFEVHALKRRLAWVPWEVLAIAAALWVLSRLRGGGALIQDPRLDIQRPSALLLAFPVLFVAGFATVGARLLVAVLRRAGARADESPASYLAMHRLTGLPGLTILLIGATALCLGVFVNGQTLVRSLRTTVDAKAGVFVGSDVQVLIDYEAPEQERFPLPITRSTRLKYAGSLEPGGVPFDILGIDADTIVGAAYWQDAFADASLAELVAPLRSEDGPLPVILVQGGGDPSEMRTAQAEIPIKVVGRADAFPGVSSDDPVIVVDVDSLRARVGPQGNPFLSANARTEYWIAGETEEALAAVGQLDAYPLGTLTIDEVQDVPFIKAAIETFSMLNLLGLAAAMLVVGVLVVYLQARQRARTVSNVLSLRMGMRDAQAARALILELGLILVIAFALGATLGLVAGALVSPLLDPLQTIPPTPLFAVPASILAWTMLGLVIVAALGGWVVHRRAAGVDLGEVLRVAE